ncbi:hypothetical protein MmazTMA_16390 [Methanosarcina mazei]|nr:hypothetical protein MmazTMA_16390 [Methanosarcina mazei]
MGIFNNLEIVGAMSMVLHSKAFMGLPYTYIIWHNCLYVFPELLWFYLFRINEKLLALFLDTRNKYTH